MGIVEINNSVYRPAVSFDNPCWFKAKVNATRTAGSLNKPAQVNRPGCGCRLGPLVVFRLNLELGRKLTQLMSFGDPPLDTRLWFELCGGL